MSSSQGERLRAVIESDILSMKLRPGDRLDEAKLAERYGTSRTPVREALRNLSAQGLVEIRPHKGAFVAKFGLRDLIELLEVLAELEGACGRFAAKSCLPADLTEIFTALRLCEKHAAANDTERYKNSNDAFHDAIYRASHNGHLIMLTRGMRKRVALYRNIQLDNMSRVQNSVEEHQLIAGAIREGMPEEADRLLQLHVLNVGAELRQLFAAVSTLERNAHHNGHGLRDAPASAK
jgi:DNA-binding GntR family transcriptional regulator